MATSHVTVQKALDVMISACTNIQKVSCSLTQLDQNVLGHGSEVEAQIRRSLMIRHTISTVGQSDFLGPQCDPRF